MNNSILMRKRHFHHAEDIHYRTFALFTILCQTMNFYIGIRHSCSSKYGSRSWIIPLYDIFLR